MPLLYMPRYNHFPNRRKTAVMGTTVDDWKSLRTRQVCSNTFSRYTPHFEKFAAERFPCLSLFPSAHICSAFISLTPWPLCTSRRKNHLLCRPFTASSCIIPSLQLGLQAPSPFHGRVLIWFSFPFTVTRLSLCPFSSFFPYHSLPILDELVQLWN